nr:hypothetical protein Iba_chr04aCG18930 [Ipomoea batatas]
MYSVIGSEQLQRQWRRDSSPVSIFFRRGQHNNDEPRMVSPSPVAIRRSGASGTSRRFPPPLLSPLPADLSKWSAKQAVIVVGETEQQQRQGSTPSAAKSWISSSGGLRTQCSRVRWATFAVVLAAQGGSLARPRCEQHGSFPPPSPARPFIAAASRIFGLHSPPRWLSPLLRMSSGLHQRCINGTPSSVKREHRSARAGFMLLMA